MKLLLVEDEIKLRDELKLFLENNGYQVDTIDEFDDTLNLIKKSNSDLILMDINLPNINGEYLVKELRKEINTPIIMVTSKNTEIDELMSINYGADDFVTKPYNPQILLARIERLLVRTKKQDSVINYKDLILDISKSLIKNNDITIELSKNEFRIFYFLLVNQGKIISRDDLMNYLWDNNEFIDDNTLTVNINRLRSKLESIGYNDVIVTRRGQGYIIL